MHISNISKFLNDNPKLKQFLRESGCHLSRINELIQTPHDRVSKDYTRSTIKSKFVTYEVKGDDFYIKVQTDIEFERLYLESLYVKDGMF